MWKNEFVLAVQRRDFDQAKECLEYRLAGEERTEALQAAMEAVLKDKPFRAEVCFYQAKKTEFLLENGAKLAGHEEALAKTENPLLVEVGLHHAAGQTRISFCKAVVASQNIRMPEMLVLCWGDVSVSDADGHDLLHYVELSGHLEIVLMVKSLKHDQEAVLEGISRFRAGYVPKLDKVS